MLTENNNKEKKPVNKPLYVLLGLTLGINFFPPINFPPINEKLSKNQIEKMIYNMYWTIYTSLLNRKKMKWSILSIKMKVNKNLNLRLILLIDALFSSSIKIDNINRKYNINK